LKALIVLREHYDKLLVLTIILILFIVNINVTYYTSHTIPLLTLARAFTRGLLYLEPRYCKYVDTILIDGKCVFAAPPGLPLIISPFTIFYDRIGSLVTGGIVVAVFGFLAVISTVFYTRVFTNDWRKAVFYSVVIALAGPLWIYSTHVFPQAPIAFTYTLLIYLALKALRNELKTPLYLLAGFTASLTILLNPAMFIPVLTTALIVFIKHVLNVREGYMDVSTMVKHVVLFILGILPLTIFLLEYNKVTTGDPFVFPEFLWLKKIGIPYPGFTTPIHYGLYILLLDYRKGLIPLYPLFAILLIYTPRLLRDLRSVFDRVLIIFAVITPLIIHAMWYDVDGGLSFGPRFIVPLTTLFTPSLRYVFESKRRLIHLTTFTLILYGIVVNAVTATVTPYPCTFEDLKPWENQFINRVIPRLDSNIRSSYLYRVFKQLGEPLSTVSTIMLNMSLSIIAILILYVKYVVKEFKTTRVIT